ncbi:ribosome biogenesis GTP-binding protein YsxC [Candidatus Acetothermia bacterium]|nr:ribosome biogenesis GTP-binding protein YsxC [Candidatus Acetothermia bacterium]MBI3643161.1 ribosome biogenesis GTP-binding protein YsxC [Candidatus Acetothermia bacterium]
MHTGMLINTSEFVKGIRGSDPILLDGIPQIVFAGRSNVGKSSVINSLVHKKDLVKVSKKPGKTTEINFFLINRKFYFVDLPGYGYAKLSLDEKEKIRKHLVWYLTYSGVKPEKIIIILDIKIGLTDRDLELIKILKEQKHAYLFIANKMDKLSRHEIAQQMALIKRESGVDNVIPYSAKTGAGKDLLLETLFPRELFG